jgi:hypothetical protein
VIGAGIIHPICNRFMTEMLSFGCTQQAGGLAWRRVYDALGERRAVVLIHISNSPRHSRPKDGVASLAYAARLLSIRTGVIHRPLPIRRGASAFPFSLSLT